MTVVFVGDHPEVDELLERRRVLGLDGHDEVWEGNYHVAPHANARHSQVQVELAAALRPAVRALGHRLTIEFNLGDPDNYRVPDLGIHATSVTELYVPTALGVIEVLSPDDKTFEKFSFYADRGVGEVVVVDPIDRTVQCWRLDAGRYAQVEEIRSAGVTDSELGRRIDWP